MIYRLDIRFVIDDIKFAVISFCHWSESSLLVDEFINWIWLSTHVCLFICKERGCRLDYEETVELGVLFFTYFFWFLVLNIVAKNVVKISNDQKSCEIFGYIEHITRDVDNDVVDERDYKHDDNL